MLDGPGSLNPNGVLRSKRATATPGSGRSSRLLIVRVAHLSASTATIASLGKRPSAARRAGDRQIAIGAVRSEDSRSWKQSPGPCAVFAPSGTMAGARAYRPRMTTRVGSVVCGGRSELVRDAGESTRGQKGL
jgi:hypothetical protein